MNDLVTGDHWDFCEISNIIKCLRWIHNMPQKAAVSKSLVVLKKTSKLGQVRNEIISSESLSLRKHARKPSLINWKHRIKVH